MKRMAIILPLGCLFLLIAGTYSKEKLPQRKGIYNSPKQAGPDFQIQGEYEGKISGQGKYGIQVVALDQGKFDVYFLGGGLPGDGWDSKTRIKISAETQEGSVRFSGEGYSGTIANGKVTGKTEKGEELNFQRVARKSPTEGAKAPKGAIILFDGSSAEKWSGGKVMEGNLLYCGCRSKERYGIGKYHIEFRCPFRPRSRGQGRGNSGVYILGREIQVLDSFGLEGKKNECGAIYGRAQPRINMCFPPLSWQTFDAEYKQNDKGEIFATVWHNGIKIHENLSIGRRGSNGAQINLQNHGNPVVFRNIWFVPGS